ncbi:ORF133 [White spot syndrome virus]|uniref:Wsv270 n=7 Tax=White spot syndrome virus TaxID=342409 RepID=Q77J37_WSSVS|nr:wsv270 [Shrimp white spot syndrome virus]YP_009220567.1 hypothetical protein SWSSV_gp093 [White spot syndrome virus]AYW76587.1 hypothetical protein [Procambarus clarkii virus]AAK77802.1 ORF133 [White spot syndrome virus]AAL33273.1 wsv270 [Shrimp white spot syndrome virus]AAL89193.1 WSSV325 [Shrimp white spot syndrome virus]AFX59644.1 wsv270 [White spot syndrome virus]
MIFFFNSKNTILNKLIMKKYLVVDCDSPLPTLCYESVASKKQRIMKKITENVSKLKKGENILVGVTWDEDDEDLVNRHETCLQTVIEMINMSANKTLFEDYMIIGGKSMDIEAGLDKPRDLDSKLVILSDRPSTMQLMKEKNCWANKHCKLNNTLLSLKATKKDRRHRRR